MVGQTVAHYQITEKLGEGGMGEVYKARDTRLDRFVAIKVLPEHVSRRQDLRERFEREARTVASLNHPHICVLHDIGPNYMVMELIEGETLAARIEKGPIPLEQALAFAIQIGDALDRAHRAGVTHRDVKPSNIMITRDGVKVLDFGLAKSMPKPSASEAALTATLTTEGTVVGTPQYMAPEQFEGKEADTRSDIWAFGAVAYEMITGQRAFQGKSYTSLVGAILAADPAPMAVKPFTPASLERLVRRCLAKDAEDRYQSIRDVVLDLQAIPTAPEETRGPARTAKWPWAVAALSTLALVSISAIHLREQAPQPRPMRFEVSLADAEMLFSNQYPSVSPDGQSIVIGAASRSGQSSLWLRPLSSQTAQRLPGGGGWDHCWSPDSKSITYAAGKNIMRLEIGGGGPRTLVADTRKVLGIQGPIGIACSPRAILIGSSQGPLFQMAPDGGELKPLTRLDAKANQTAHQYPQFLPGGDRFIFSAVGGSGAGVFTGSLDSPEVKRILAGTGRALFVSNGYLLYPLGQALVAHRFDPASLTLSGEPVRIADHVQQSQHLRAYAGYSANPDILAYRVEEPEQPNELAWYDRSGKRIETVGEPATYSNPALSPDGRRLAIGRGELGKRDIWVIDLARGTSTRLTFDPADDLNPAWSADGREFFFTSERSGFGRLFRKSISGVSEERPFNEGGSAGNFAESISLDGKTVFYSTSGDIWMASCGGGKTRLAVGGPGSQSNPAISPDGNYIAYASSESGRWEIYVQNFPPKGGKWQVSVAGGLEPAWRHDGRELYYRRDRAMMAVPITIFGDTLEAGTPVPLFEAPFPAHSFRNSYVVTRDGSRFLIVTQPQVRGKAAFNVVVNWAAGLPK